MDKQLPEAHVARAPQKWSADADLAALDWSTATLLPRFRLVDNSGLAQQQTECRVCYDDRRLCVRFDCDDVDIWGTMDARDAPIYDEEVVELFLAPGVQDPTHYFEFEVSPHGVLFDARIHNPTGHRADLAVDLAWDCPGIEWSAGRDDGAARWWAILATPWAGLASTVDLPRIWRANFYRIERPRQAAPEFSAWSPTLTEPADFHKPARFGILHLR